MSMENENHLANTYGSTNVISSGGLELQYLPSGIRSVKQVARLGAGHPCVKMSAIFECFTGLR